MTTPSPRILGFSALPLATALLVAPLFVATPTNAGANWLEVRRGGAVRILDAARRAGTPQSWGATYTARVRDKRHAALTNVTIAVARRQLPAAKGKPAVFETTVVIRGLKGGLAGIATSGDTAHVRLPGAAKAVPATGKELFTRLPGLRSPLALFAVLELSHLFDVKLEGEFDGTGVMRMTPKYHAGRDVQLCKLGISKQTRFPTMAEVGRGDGRDDVKLAWIDTRKVRGVKLPATLRLMLPGKAGHVDFRRSKLVLGKAAKKLRFGPSALR